MCGWRSNGKVADSSAAIKRSRSRASGITRGAKALIGNDPFEQPVRTLTLSSKKNIAFLLQCPSSVASPRCAGRFDIVKKTCCFSLFACVILSAGAMLIFSVLFQIDQMPEGESKHRKSEYILHLFSRSSPGPLTAPTLSTSIPNIAQS